MIENKAQVLVVDDDPDICEVISCALVDLEDENVEIITSNNPVEALEIIRTKNISVIVSDIKMPEMDGLALGNEIRKFDNDLPIIFVTGHQELCTITKALSLRTYDFILKPFDKNMIVKSVDNALRVRSRRIEELNLIRKIENFMGISDESKAQKLNYRERELYLDRLIEELITRASKR
ncbi:MAG: response regulator [Oligoflexia bacterium]|nr:response regulator [Oligoflexia bacterium]